MPPLILRLPGDNTFSNYSEAHRAFWRQTVLPLVTRVQKSFQAWLAPGYGPFRFDYNADRLEVLASKRAAEWDRIGKPQFLTLDEQREAVGYGPAPRNALFDKDDASAEQGVAQDRSPSCESSQDSTDAVGVTHDASQTTSLVQTRQARHCGQRFGGPRHIHGDGLMAPPETKRADAPIARTTAAGIIEGYASLFGVADTGGDIVMKGAFARSLVRRGAAGVKMLWQHNAAEPIGVWTSLVEDEKGLKVVGRLDLSVARAREALSLLRAGAIDGLSIGFKAERATTDKASGLRRLLAIDLWEISIVTFPMLTQARIEAVKREPLRTGDEMRALLARLKAQEAALRFQRRLQAAGF